MRVCVSVRLWTLSRSHFFVDFHQIGHRRVGGRGGAILTSNELVLTFGGFGLYAIAMGQIKIVLRLCVRVCVCPSVDTHSRGRISSSIFTKLDTDV